ncbi:MAG: amino acid adenylation domain-containing protein [Eubacteriales bacterium]|nr:amino acid adenylation domain-containing protein [Eubacteriales bacterium]
MVYNVLDYLERAGEKHPDKVVFADPLHEITYKECIRNARSIGTRIARMGRTCKPVAVLIDREIESLEMFMGSVYSDNFYVPVGKKLPPGRISMILKSVHPLCLLCRESDREFVLSLDYDGEVLFYEEIVGTEADEELLLDIRKRHIDTNPLYAIYTSGSTGTPKGVLVCHRSVIDLVEQFADCFGFDENEVFGNQAPFDFDVSVKDIYSTLRNGATMCIVTQRMISFPKELIPYLNEKKITTVIWAVSALALTASFKGLERDLPKYLKKIMFSGEVMPVKVLNYWREKLPDAMYVNLYGPTEITCNCSYYIVDREFGLNETLPIGTAFPNTEMFLLNEQNQPAGENEIGEICVRGTSLALGYYRNPEATEKAFCQNPLNQDYPELIYRTGDLGRYRDGELYYVTRRDFQIKHMGHRIELGEIETVLDSLDYISRSCCIYDGQREKIYMFYQAEEACDRRIVKDLQVYLPKYMCPNKYVFMEQLPLNKNGKIDRAALKERYISHGKN